VTLAAMAGLGAWLLLRRGPEAKEGEQRPVAQVQVAAVRVGPIIESLPAAGLIEPGPSGSRAVALAYDSIVTRIAISQGATVAEGDLLMEVAATPDAALAVASARSAAQLAEQTLASTRQRFDLKLAISQDLAVAEQAAADARSRLASLEGRGQSGDGRILAPQAGVVTKLDVQPGAVVPVGAALVTVAGRAQLEAHLAIELADAPRVHAGQSVEVSAADRPAAAGAVGPVREVGAAVDPVSGAVDVRVTLPVGMAWFAGEHVQGAIHVSERTALVAPRSAMMPEGDHWVLYTVKDGKAVRHAVGLGIVAGDDAEVIANDIHAGDAAVVLGNYELEDGMAVEVSAGAGKPASADDSRSRPE